MLVVLTARMLTGDMAPTARIESVWLIGQVLTFLLSFIIQKNSTSFYFGRWNSGINLDLEFASANSDSRLPDRRALEKFPQSQHRPL